MNLIAGDATGRLLKYERATGRTTTLAKGIFYANGVALTPGEKAVLVVDGAGDSSTSTGFSSTRVESEAYLV